MKILCIDTTTKFLCLGLYVDARIYEYSLETGRHLSTLLAPAVRSVLEAAGVKAPGIDYFCVGAGPGSFTGVRVGMAYIKGLAWSVGKPVVEIPSLEALAMNAAGARDNAWVWPIMDAKRGLVYTCAYRIKGAKLKKASPYMLIDIGEFMRKTRDSAIVLGDGLELYRDKLKASGKGLAFLDKDYWRIYPQNLLACAMQRIREKKLVSASGARPIYLYPKECQVKSVTSKPVTRK